MFQHLAYSCPSCLNSNSLLSNSLSFLPVFNLYTLVLGHGGISCLFAFQTPSSGDSKTANFLFNLMVTLTTTRVTALENRIRVLIFLVLFFFGSSSQKSFINLQVTSFMESCANQLALWHHLLLHMVLSLLSLSLLWMFSHNFFMILCYFFQMLLSTRIVNYCYSIFLKCRIIQQHLSLDKIFQISNSSSSLIFISRICYCSQVSTWI